jgi:phage tail-like protein
MEADAIGRLLPAAYQRSLPESPVLRAMLDVMAGLHERSEAQLDKVEDLFHPYRCPEFLLPFLARWVSVDHLGFRRDLIARGAALAQSRGTRLGLAEALRLATGLSEVEIEEPPSRPFHFIVRVPADYPHMALLSHLVELEKPAATTFEMGTLS